MEKTAELTLDGKSYKLPIVEGTEKERAVDISALRNQTGYITLDDGYGNAARARARLPSLTASRGFCATAGSRLKSWRRNPPLSRSPTC